jgi:hypothetical protein
MSNHPEPKILIDLPSNIQIDKKTFQKMVFITNAIEQGWAIKKRGDSYVFTKKHENRCEVFREDYLEKFVISNMDNDKIFGLDR